MSFFDSILLDIIFLIFPIVCYFVLLVYKTNINDHKNLFLLDIANATSLFLIIHFSSYYSYNYYLMLLVNIPLLISYLYKRKFSSLVFSIIIVVYYYNFYHLTFLFVIVEYLLYYILFIYVNRRDKSPNFFINVFTFIKGFVLSFVIVNILPAATIYEVFIYLFLVLIIFYTLSIFILNLVYKTKEIIVFHNLLKQLEKEKTLKNALFQITHEVKNPLAVCKGYLSMIDYDNLKKTEKYIDVIKNEVDRTLNMLDDFSDYNKIKVELEEIDLHLLLEETIASIELLFNINDLKLIKDIVDDEIYIMGDYNRLKQVFINIIKNAIEACKNTKKVIEINLYLKNKKVYLIVRDYGCGMDKETLSRIGELFYTTKVKGTGLGVGISKEILKQHNATIDYESKVGRGTKVTICFPML